MQDSVYISYDPADIGLARFLKETFHGAGVATIDLDSKAIDLACRFVAVVSCDLSGAARYNGVELAAALEHCRKNRRGADRPWLTVVRIAPAEVSMLASSSCALEIIDIPWDELLLSRRPATVHPAANATLNMGNATIDGDIEVTNLERQGDVAGGDANLSLNAGSMAAGGAFRVTNARVVGKGRNE